MISYNMILIHKFPHIHTKSSFVFCAAQLLKWPFLDIFQKGHSCSRLMVTLKKRSAVRLNSSSHDVIPAEANGEEWTLSYDMILRIWYQMIWYQYTSNISFRAFMQSPKHFKCLFDRRVLNKTVSRINRSHSSANMSGGAVSWWWKL